MRNLIEINSKNLYCAIYEACFKANIELSSEVFSALKKIENEGLEDKNKTAKIFANNYIASTNKRPLCQDTGQVIVFFEIGENIILSENNPIEIANQAVADCYKDNFFRKSVVKDAIFDRTNTQNNTPVITYINYSKEENIKVDVLIKGGGAENMSSTKMLTPSTTEKEIFDYVLSVVDNAGENACPPLLLGVGIGGTIDYAAVLSKKAFFSEENKEFSKKLQNYINEKSKTKIAQIHTLTSSTHIASMPVCVTVNCHSTRHASAIVDNNGYKITTKFDFAEKVNYSNSDLPIITTEDVSTLKKLNCGQELLLSGVVYTARDAAHKKLVEMINNGEKLPFELKNSIIFYAGPCPKNNNEVIGPVGPTTSKRMDKFAITLYKHGVLATIGKGERSENVKQSIKDNNFLYFSVQGGTASLLQSCVKSAQVVAFEELGTEAIYKLEIEKLPVKLELN